MDKRVLLMILDGWGHGKKDHTNAIYLAKTPFTDSLYNTYPNAQLRTFGLEVGLPDGQMGNSEVGHLNIGAGRIVYQDFAKINKAILDDQLSKNKALLEAIDYAKKNQKPIHFLGLVSDGGIHSHLDHLVELCKITHSHNIPEVYIHAFTDGRDTDPKSSISSLQKVEKGISNTNAKIVSVVGRYYAMDRDKRWERVKVAYDLLVKGIGENTSNLFDSIQKQYDAGITDEFLTPLVNSTPHPIEQGDVVICFNFRTDRCRQISYVLSQAAIPEYELNPLSLYYVTMTNYDSTFKNVHVLFEKDNLTNTLGEIVSKHNKTQVRVAETEKYPHVTFFFSGGREEPFPKESRLLINSPKVATYDLQPQMSADEVTEKVLTLIEKKSADFICLNFANPDMVGHTGNQPAIIKAIETIDSKVQQIVKLGIEKEYQLLIIADHGNAEKNFNEDGSPHTAHTTNLVPCIAINTPFKHVRDGILADIAPTLLHLLGLPKPKEMTGESLLN